jgi:hypothetical protein
MTVSPGDVVLFDRRLWDFRERVGEGVCDGGVVYGKPTVSLRHSARQTYSIVRRRQLRWRARGPAVPAWRYPYRTLEGVTERVVG